MSSEDFVERRKDPRASARPPFEVKVLAAKTSSGLALDLSQSGMLVELDGQLPRVGSEVQLKFQLPKLPRMTTPALVVRHAGPRRIGVKFLRLSIDELASITRYVEGRDG